MSKEPEKQNALHVTFKRCSIPNPAKLLPTEDDGDTHNRMDVLSLLNPALIYLKHPSLTSILSSTLMAQFTEKMECCTQVMEFVTNFQLLKVLPSLISAPWANRGFITSTGTPIKHGELIGDLLDAYQLPASVVKCEAHTDTVSQGDAMADLVAKAAAKIGNPILAILSSFRWTELSI